MSEAEIDRGLALATSGNAFIGAWKEPSTRETIATVPRVARCGEPVEQWPIVDTGGEGVKLNGKTVDAAALQDELRTLHNNHVLLHPNDPPTRWAVLLLAPSETPTQRLLPLFTAIRAAGFTDVDALVIVPHVDETRTLGPLDRPSLCKRTLVIDELDRARLPPTWAALSVHDAL